MLVSWKEAITECVELPVARLDDPSRIDHWKLESCRAILQMRPDVAKVVFLLTDDSYADLLEKARRIQHMTARQKNKCRRDGSIDLPREYNRKKEP